jgi:hypothetical protein
MWYNTVPPFIPMDANRYSMYYFGIKRFDLLIFGRKERPAIDPTQTKLMPPIEQLKQIQYPIRILTSGLEQPILIPRGILVQQIVATILLVNMVVINGLLVQGNDVSF